MDKSGELVGKYDPGSGDPDWEPDWTSPTRVLIWADHPWRIVAMAYGDGQDDLTYVVEWQHRNHGQWDLAWQGEQRARMRLPSDWTARDQLAERIQANDPRSADEPEPR